MLPFFCFIIIELAVSAGTKEGMNNLYSASVKTERVTFSNHNKLVTPSG